MNKIRLSSLVCIALIAGCQEYSVANSNSQSFAAEITPPATFRAAKQAIYRIHSDHQETFYCGCSYSGRKVDTKSCGYERRKNARRARRTEIEHVFPASHFGQHLSCWHDKPCTDRRGKAYGGRRCCNKIDPAFKRMHNDLHNLQPAIGEVNGDRGNRRFAQVSANASHKYGACPVKIDFDRDRIEPPDNRKGDVARTYFYMRDTYGIRLSKQQAQLFEAWNRLDPVSDWERARNQRIERIQGNANPYIK